MPCFAPEWKHLSPRRSAFSFLVLLHGLSRGLDQTCLLIDRESPREVVPDKSLFNRHLSDRIRFTSERIPIFREAENICSKVEKDRHACSHSEYHPNPHRGTYTDCS